MNHQSSPAAVKSTNSLAILVLLQGSSHESHCTILVPHLQVDDKGATDEEDAQEMMLLLLVLMLIGFDDYVLLYQLNALPKISSTTIGEYDRVGGVNVETIAVC